MNKNILFGILAGITTAVIVSTLTSTSVAQMGSSMGGSMGGSMDMGGSMGHNMGSMPGVVQQMCHDQGNMPPHYCEPSYMVMSSVRGITISAVDAVSDKEVVLTVKQIGSGAGQMSQKMVLVGGTGDLAGSTLIDEGWERSKVVNLKLDGAGTIYDHGEMHLHLFPYAG